MRRSALRRFLERAVIATLPLAACDSQPEGEGFDLALEIDLSEPDFSDEGDAAPRTCEELHPPITVTPPGDLALPDAGAGCYGGALCNAMCGPIVRYDVCCSPGADDGGVADWWVCYYDCGPSGRRPPGLLAEAALGGCAIGRHFAQMAHLEAASVHAFALLGRELAEHDAPPSLIRAARRARADEVRHARQAGRLARAHGARPARARVAASQPRTLEEIAIENAVEGCVRETFGALLARWQARTAGDPRVRTAVAAIAEDETRHAELAWAVDAWARPKLARAARRRLAEARRAALASLRAGLADPPPALIAVAGLPTAAQSRALLDHAAQVWA